jgi:hypothetical protein
VSGGEVVDRGGDGILEQHNCYCTTDARIGTGAPVWVGEQNSLQRCSWQSYRLVTRATPRSSLRWAGHLPYVFLG